MDLILCSLPFKDRGAKKCMFGISIFIITALAILYFTLKSNEKPACLSTQKLFNLIVSGWKNSPRNVVTCNDTYSMTEDEISALGFTNVIMYTNCEAIKMNCDGDKKEIEIRCPFRLFGLNFVVNGTNSTACEESPWFNLGLDITNDTLRTGISLSSPYSFKIQPACSYYLKNVDDRVRIGVIINRLNSILTNMFNYGLRKSLNVIDLDQNTTETESLNVTRYCDDDSADIIGVTDAISDFDLDVD